MLGRLLSVSSKVSLIVEFERFQNCCPSIAACQQMNLQTTLEKITLGRLITVSCKVTVIVEFKVAALALLLVSNQ